MKDLLLRAVREAGILLIEEAGGQVSDFDGKPMTLDSLECLASNSLIHADMQMILQQGCRPQKGSPV